MPKTTKNPRSKTAQARPLRLAAIADPYDLYQRAVQCVEAEIDFVDATFKTLRGRRAVHLREDFCASANSACEWVRRRRGNTALGLDIDAAPLAWGRGHTVSALTPAQRARLELRRASVLGRHADLRGRFDIILGMNFSYYCFTKRGVLLEYFRRARGALSPDGVLFLDYMGGSDSHRELRERRVVGRGRRAFTYIWHQQKFNPITADIRCAIHFAFPDGSRLRDAFVYNWRLWGLAEIQDVLRDAGFSRITVYWEGDDGDGGGDGEFKPSTEGDACAGYIGYISAER